MTKLKKTSKTIFTDRIAVDLVNSRDKVDKRLLKLHKIASDSTQKTDLLDYLGVKDNLRRSLSRSFSHS